MQQDREWDCRRRLGFTMRLIARGENKTQKESDVHLKESTVHLKKNEEGMW
jgi:hypothetical protein